MDRGSTTSAGPFITTILHLRRDMGIRKVAMATNLIRPGDKVFDYDGFIDYRIRQTRARIKAVDLLTNTAILVTAVVSFLFVEVLLDHQWALPSAVRLGALWLLLTGIAAFLAVGIIRPLFRRINALYAARTIERTSPEFQNSLVNFLDLRRHKQGLDPSILEALEEQAVADLSQVRFDQVVSQQRLIRISYVLCAVVVVICLYTLAGRKPILTSLQRAIWPQAPIAPPTETRITDVRPGDDPAKSAVMAGSNVPIQAVVTGRPPATVTLHFTTDGDYWETTELGPPTQAFDPWQTVLRDVQHNIQYYLTAGDFQTHRYTLSVAPAPMITAVHLDYHHPKYTGFPDRHSDDGNINDIEGTRVALTATTNMPAERAELMLGERGKGQQIYPMDVDPEKPTVLRTALVLKVSRTDPNGVTTGQDMNGPYRLVFRTPSNEENPRPPIYTITVQKDFSPTVTVLRPRSDLDLPANGVLPLAVRAQDDFGLKSMVLKMWRNKHEMVTGYPRELLTKDQRRASPPPRRVVFDQPIELEPLGLQENDTVECTVVVRDNREPEPNQAESTPFTIQIKRPVEPAEQHKQLADAQNEINKALKNDAQKNHQEEEPPDQAGSPNEGEAPPPGNANPNEPRQNQDTNQAKRPRQPETGQQRPEDQQTPKEAAPQKDDQRRPADQQQANPREQKAREERNRLFEKLFKGQPQPGQGSSKPSGDRKQENTQSAPSGRGTGSQNEPSRDNRPPAEPQPTKPGQGASRPARSTPNPGAQEPSTAPRQPQGSSSQPKPSSSSKPGEQAQPSQSPAGGSPSKPGQAERAPARSKPGSGTQPNQPAGEPKSPDTSNPDQKSSSGNPSKSPTRPGEQPASSNQKPAGAKGSEQRGSQSKPADQPGSEPAPTPKTGEQPSPSNQQVPGTKGSDQGGSQSKPAHQPGSEPAPTPKTGEQPASSNQKPAGAKGPEQHGSQSQPSKTGESQSKPGERPSESGARPDRTQQTVSETKPGAADAQHPTGDEARGGTGQTGPSKKTPTPGGQPSPRGTSSQPEGSKPDHSPARPNSDNPRKSDGQKGPNDGSAPKTGQAAESGSRPEQGQAAGGQTNSQASPDNTGTKPGANSDAGHEQRQDAGQQAARSAESTSKGQDQANDRGSSAKPPEGGQSGPGDQSNPDQRTADRPGSKPSGQSGQGDQQADRPRADQPRGAGPDSRTGGKPPETAPPPSSEPSPATPAGQPDRRSQPAAGTQSPQSTGSDQGQTPGPGREAGHGQPSGPSQRPGQGPASGQTQRSGQGHAPGKGQQPGPGQPSGGQSPGTQPAQAPGRPSSPAQDQGHSGADQAGRNDDHQPGTGQKPNSTPSTQGQGANRPGPDDQAARGANRPGNTNPANNSGSQAGNARGDQNGQGQNSSQPQPGQSGATGAQTGGGLRPGKGTSERPGATGGNLEKAAKPKPQTGPDNPPQAAPPNGVKPNEQYERKATELVLNKLRDELRKDKIDPKLLKQTGLKDRKDVEDTAKMLEDLLKQAEKEGRSGPSVKRKTYSRDPNQTATVKTERLEEPGRVSVPPEYREWYEAYTRDLSRRQAAPRQGATSR